jgi:hypothetical protein
VNFAYPVCDRVPDEQRRVLFIKVRVFNEPWRDVGYDHDGDPATPGIGAGNGIFDFTDSNGNGLHDAGERSEPFMDISGGAVAFAQVGARGPIWSADQVERQLTYLRAYVASACIRVTEVAPREYPDPMGMLFLHFLGQFDDFPDDDGVTGIPSRDEAAIQTFHRSAVNLDATDDNDILDVYFVAPFTPAGGAYASQFRPAFVNANGLNPLLINQVHIGLNTVTANIPFAAVHEVLHQLTNESDVLTPAHIFFPTTGASPFDGTTVLRKRRMTNATEDHARTMRPPGMPGAVGNRLLRMP